jgi:hypothetical protein
MKVMMKILMTKNYKKNPKENINHLVKDPFDFNLAFRLLFYPPLINRGELPFMQLLCQFLPSDSAFLRGFIR